MIKRNFGILIILVIFGFPAGTLADGEDLSQGRALSRIASIKREIVFNQAEILRVDLSELDEATKDREKARLVEINYGLKLRLNELRRNLEDSDGLGSMLSSGRFPASISETSSKVQLGARAQESAVRPAQPDPRYSGKNPLVLVDW